MLLHPNRVCVTLGFLSVFFGFDSLDRKTEDAGVSNMYNRSRLEAFRALAGRKRSRALDSSLCWRGFIFSFCA